MPPLGKTHIPERQDELERLLESLPPEMVAAFREMQARNAADFNEVLEEYDRDDNGRIDNSEFYSSIAESLYVDSPGMLASYCQPENRADLYEALDGMTEELQTELSGNPYESGLGVRLTPQQTYALMKLGNLAAPSAEMFVGVLQSDEFRELVDSLPKEPEAFRTFLLNDKKIEEAVVDSYFKAPELIQNMNRYGYLATKDTIDMLKELIPSELTNQDLVTFCEVQKAALSQLPSQPVIQSDPEGTTREPAGPSH